MEWNGGMDGGMVEWNSGMVEPPFVRVAHVHAHASALNQRPYSHSHSSRGQKNGGYDLYNT